MKLLLQECWLQFVNHLRWFLAALIRVMPVMPTVSRLPRPGSCEEPVQEASRVGNQKRFETNTPVRGPTHTGSAKGLLNRFAASTQALISYKSVCLLTILLLFASSGAWAQNAPDGCTNTIMLVAEYKRPVNGTPVPGEIMTIQFNGSNPPNCSLQGGGEGIVVDSRRGRAYLADIAAQTLSVYDYRQGKIIATIGLAGSPLDVTISNDGNSIYVNTADGTISIISASSLSVVGSTNSLGSSGSPWGIAVNPANGDVYYTQNFFRNDDPDLLPSETGHSGLSRTDANLGASTFLGDSPTGTNYRGAVFGPDGNLYVVLAGNPRNGIHDAVLKMDANGGIISTFNLPDRTVATGLASNEPYDIAFGPDGNIYVTTFYGDCVIRVDAGSGSTSTYLPNVPDSFGKGIAFVCGEIVCPNACPSVNSEQACAGTSTVLTVLDCVGTVTWSDGPIGNTRTVSPSVTTTYTGTCDQFKSGCSGNVSATITVVGPSITAGTPACDASGTTYSVNFTPGGTTNSVTSSAGTVSGNSVTGIPVGTDVTLTATSPDGCPANTITITSPNCTVPCTNQPTISGSGTCDASGTTYTINFTTGGGVSTVTASAGTVSGNTVTGIPVGTNVTLTANPSSAACTAATTTVNSPNCTVPCTNQPTISGSGTCDASGTTYTINFTTGGGVSTVTASAGTVSGNTVTGIPVGTNVTLTANPSSAACTAATTTVSSPNCNPACLNPPSISGTGVCDANGTTYTINFTSSGGISTITASAGTVSGNTVTGVPVGTNVTLTANPSDAACVASTNIVTSPNCTVPCTNQPTISGSGTCNANGTTYTINFTTGGGVSTVTASAGTVSGNTVTGIPVGTNVTLTANPSSAACTAATTTVNSPNCTVPCTNQPTISGSGTCNANGTTYTINFTTGGGVSTVTASAGTVSGNTVTGIPVGTNVTLTANPSSAACTAATTTITSPACTLPCSLSISAAPGPCVQATNLYTVTGTLTLTNAVAGTATITDGSVNTSVIVTAGATSVSYTLTGLTSGVTQHTVSVSLPGCGTATRTYIAPDGCLCPSPNCYPTTITKN
ncbi:hypothetical protein [Spirosoma sp.]|uniref:hypothetical protein n=1 Tax=Spirosoma sp. TaxID=1899569 RepID=UPI0026394308|nr:hypothetical protein [Spirosoma sp.]MCX6218563.1 hypothetical protein [Spirosoma sp.]